MALSVQQDEEIQKLQKKVEVAEEKLAHIAAQVSVKTGHICKM